MSPPFMSTSVKVNVDHTEVVSHVAGLSGKKIQEFAQDVKRQAKANASAAPFVNPSGGIEEGVKYTKTGPMSATVETTSGHTSFIEMGTEFIKGKIPIFWPAYQIVKRKFFGGGKWA